ncbi:MAG: glycosyltransferase family 2 protein [Oscillospiraceae bacterium]
MSELQIEAILKKCPGFNDRIIFADKIGFGENETAPRGRLCYPLNGSEFVCQPGELKDFVMFREDKEAEDIMVSISMTAYNQEPYIARALESILKQEVNFRYEIIVGEDCSTDKTRQIIESYRQKYPDIIKPIYHPVNVGLRINNDMVRRRLRGKYRAILEGDDYWLSTDKMQSQVDFLEKNPDFVGITGNYIDVDKNGKLLKRPNPQIYSSESVFNKEELEKWKMPSNTLALTHRNIFRDCGEEVMQRFEKASIIGDRKLFTFLLMYGDIYHSEDNVAVRMVLPVSPTSWAYAQRHSNMCPITHTWLTNAENYAKTYGKELDLTEKKIENWAIAIKCYLKNPSKRNLYAVREIRQNIPVEQRKQYNRGAFRYCMAAVKKVYNGKNFITGTVSLFGKGVKFVGKAFKFAFKKAETNDRLKKFI